MVLYVTESQVAELVSVEDAMTAVEKVGRSMAAGDVVFVPRTRLRMRNGFLHFMPASLEKEGVFGYKAYSSFKGIARFYVHLFDNNSGELLALIAADKLGQLRTGAASGVATKVLAREKAATLGLFGSGYQAESQLIAVSLVRNFKTAKVYSKDLSHAERFCEKMQKSVKADIVPVKTAEECAAADVIVTATSASSPVVPGEAIRRGTHVNAVGANTLIKRELDEMGILKADKIVIDSIEQGKSECGDFMPLVEKGKLNWANLLEFKDLFNGRAVRKSDDEITLFKSQGISPWDVALAKVVFDRAVAAKIGSRLDI